MDFSSGWKPYGLTDSAGMTKSGQPEDDWKPPGNNHTWYDLDYQGR